MTKTLRTQKTLAIVDAPVASLHPHPRNPRRITPARLEQLQRTLAAEPEMLRADPAYCDVIRQRYADYTGRPELAP